MAANAKVYWSESYREPLCQQDERGVPMFSPMCGKQPNITGFTGVFGNKNVNGDFETNGLFAADGKKTDRSRYEFTSKCKLAPLPQPKAQVQQFDDSMSACDFFKDPTYGQRAALRKAFVDEATISTNPCLVNYQKIKALEKSALSSVQTL